MSHARRLVLALTATCLVVALAAPTAGAARAQDGSPTATSAVSKQTLAKNIRKANRRAKAARRAAAKVDVDLTQLGSDLRAAISGGDKSLDDKINGIVGVVTPVLQQLGDGTLALRDGLEKLAAATTAGFAQVTTGFAQVESALTRIGSYLGATEYGVAQAIVLEGGDPSAANPQEGHFVVTPDLPDTVQQGQSTQQFVADVATPGPVIVQYAVRSGENDGDGTVPAAHCRVTVSNEGGTTQSTTGGLGNLGFLPLAERSALTSTDPANVGFPLGLKTVGDDADKTETFVASTVIVGNGDTYTVGLACVDTSPDADDPQA